MNCSNRLYLNTHMLIWLLNFFHILAWTKTNKLKLHITRKHRQSYRHADPHRQRPPVAQDYAIPVMVTSNRAIVTVFLIVWPWPLTFWPLGRCMPTTAIEYTCTKFGDDHFSRFLIRARKSRQTKDQKPKTGPSSLCTICNYCILLYVYVYKFCTQLRLTSVF